jgi:hypothetical protein
MSRANAALGVAVEVPPAVSSGACDSSERMSFVLSRNCAVTSVGARAKKSPASRQPLSVLPTNTLSALRSQCAREHCVGARGEAVTVMFVSV